MKNMSLWSKRLELCLQSPNWEYMAHKFSSQSFLLILSDFSFKLFSTFEALGPSVAIIYIFRHNISSWVS